MRITMEPLTFTLTLVVAMTTAQGEVKVQGNALTDFLKLRVHQDHYYWLDVTTEASEEDLKAAMRNLTLDHSYKVVSEPHYLFVFRSNDTAALRSVTFPQGSKVTQFPVERGDQLFETLGLNSTDAGSGEWEHPESSTPDDVHFFSDWTLDLPKDLCPETFETELRSWVNEVKNVAGTFKASFFPIIATYPTRFLSIWDLEENVLQHGNRHALPTFGGYGTSQLHIKRVVKVHI